VSLANYILLPKKVQYGSSYMHTCLPLFLSYSLNCAAVLPILYCTVPYRAVCLAISRDLSFLDSRVVWGDRT